MIAIRVFWHCGGSRAIIEPMNQWRCQPINRLRCELRNRGSGTVLLDDECLRLVLELQGPESAQRNTVLSDAGD